MKTKLLLGIIFILAGIAFLTGSIIMTLERIEMHKGWISTDGTVLILEEYVTESIDNNLVKKKYLLFRPVLQFEVPDGKIIRYTSSSGSNTPLYTPGQKVKMLYNPEKPQEAIIDSPFELWLLPGILAVLGILLFPIGTALIYLHNKARCI